MLLLTTWIPPNVLCRFHEQRYAQLHFKKCVYKPFYKRRKETWNTKGQWVPCLQSFGEVSKALLFYCTVPSLPDCRFVYRFSVPNFVIIFSPASNHAVGVSVCVRLFSLSFFFHTLLWRYIDCYVCSINVAITNVFGSKLSNIQI